MNLNELVARLELPVRQIRHLTAEGVLPPATEKGRSADGYTEEHVKRGEIFKKLYEGGGLSVRRIGELMASRPPEFFDDVDRAAFLLRAAAAFEPKALFDDGAISVHVLDELALAEMSDDDLDRAMQEIEQTIRAERANHRKRK